MASHSGWIVGVMRKMSSVLANSSTCKVAQDTEVAKVVALSQHAQAGDRRLAAGGKHVAAELREVKVAAAELKRLVVAELRKQAAGMRLLRRATAATVQMQHAAIVEAAVTAQSHQEAAAKVRPATTVRARLKVTLSQ